ARDRFEFLDAAIVSRISAPADGLQPAASVNMSDRRKNRALILANRVNLLHERIWRTSNEIIVHRFLENRRRKRTEFFAELDLEIYQVAHVGSWRVRKNAAVAERACSPFHLS